VTKFSKINCKREELDTLLKRFWKHEALTTGTKAADRSTRVLKTEENVINVGEKAGLLSQEGQKQTPRSTRQIFRVTTGSNTCSIVRIIHRDLCL